MSYFSGHTSILSRSFWIMLCMALMGILTSGSSPLYRSLTKILVTAKPWGNLEGLHWPYPSFQGEMLVSCFFNQSTVISLDHNSLMSIHILHPLGTSLTSRHFHGEKKKKLLRAAKIPLTENLYMISLRTPSALLLSCSGCHLTPLCTGINSAVCLLACEDQHRIKHSSL